MSAPRYFLPPLAAAPAAGFAAPAAGLAAAAPPAAGVAPSAPSAPSSALAFFFFLRASFRTRTLGRPRTLWPSVQRSDSFSLSTRSPRVSTLRFLIAPALTRRLLSIVNENSFRRAHFAGLLFRMGTTQYKGG